MSTFLFVLPRGYSSESWFVPGSTATTLLNSLSSVKDAVRAAQHSGLWNAGFSLSWSLKGSPMYSQFQKISPHRLMVAFLVGVTSTPMFTGHFLCLCGLLSLFKSISLSIQNFTITLWSHPQTPSQNTIVHMIVTISPFLSVTKVHLDPVHVCVSSSFHAISSHIGRDSFLSLFTCSLTFVCNLPCPLLLVVSFILNSP